MNLSERQEILLETIIKDYIKLATPISSEFIVKHYDFGIKEAMIRKEMQKLGELGFIEQPYTSGGRIPTDKSYKFLVEKILKEDKTKEDEFGNLKKLFEEDKSFFHHLNATIEYLKNVSSCLFVLNFLKNDFLIKEGWEKVIKEPEFKEKSVYLEFIELLEKFQSKIKKLNRVFKKLQKKDLKFEKKINVFIGRDNPFFKSDKFSIIVSSCCFGKKDRVIISFLGPKRMHYDKNIQIIKSLTNLLEDI